VPREGFDIANDIGSSIAGNQRVAKRRPNDFRK
jgi:hypothetical protein